MTAPPTTEDLARALERWVGRPITSGTSLDKDLSRAAARLRDLASAYKYRLGIEIRLRKLIERAYKAIMKPHWEEGESEESVSGDLHWEMHSEWEPRERAMEAEQDRIRDEASR